MRIDKKALRSELIEIGAFLVILGCLYWFAATFSGWVRPR